ncbi:MAG: tetratricopeptide repeat protein [Candidatus Eisenbacteria bacterium]
MSREQYAAQLKAAGIRPYVRTLEGPLLAKDVATARIIDLYYGKRPLYLALTVPDQMGLDNRLVQEGIVFRIDEPQGTEPRVNGPRSRDLLVDAYRYRGILDENGRHDDSSYLDPNSSRLVQNYAASHLSLAQQLVRDGKTEEALALAMRAREISPRASAVNYSLGVLLQRLGRYEDMEALFRNSLDSGNITPDTYSFLGLSLELQSRLGEAEKVYEEAVATFPDDFELHRVLFALRWRDLGRYQEAVDVLDSWSRLHPEDTQVRAAISAYRDSANILTRGTPNSP